LGLQTKGNGEGKGIGNSNGKLTEKSLCRESYCYVTRSGNDNSNYTKGGIVRKKKIIRKRNINYSRFIKNKF